MADNGYQHLGPKTLLFFILRDIIPVFMILLPLLVFWWAANFFSNIVLINQYLQLINQIFLLLIFLGLVLLLLVALIAWWQYKNFKFKIADESFKIMRGVLTREDIALPYRRIQAVDLKTSLLGQIFGVSRLTIETVADPAIEADEKKDSDDEVLPVVDRHLAKYIQEELTRRANIQKMNVHQQ